MKLLKYLYRTYSFGIFLSFTIMFLHGLVDNFAPLNAVKMTMVGISGIGHILITLAVILVSIKALRAKEIAQ